MIIKFATMDCSNRVMWCGFVITWRGSVISGSSLQNAGCQMHCLLAASLTYICLRFAYFLLVFFAGRAICNI